MDIEQARFNMIEQQIRPWEVLDSAVLQRLKQIPREDFVPDGYMELAFADIQIPISHGEVMMEPKIEARLLQELKLKDSDKVLEIGTGSGYMTALLASMTQSVVSIEIHPDLSRGAAECLNAHGITNVMLETGDASLGWPVTDGFDAIILTGSVPQIPTAFTNILRPGGRLVAIVGSDPTMEAVRIENSSEGLIRSSLFDTLLPPLVNAIKPKKFVF